MTPSINGMFNEEVRNLVGINERTESESEEIQSLRIHYGVCMFELITIRDKVGRSEAGRQIAIAITELESSCMRAIKGLYSKSE